VGFTAYLDAMRRLFIIVLLFSLLSDSRFVDRQVYAMPSQAAADLTPNAQMLALKEPWRYPFSRLRLGCPIHDDTTQQFWGAFTAQHDNVNSDNNAHGFTASRFGIAIGNDSKPFSFNSKKVTEREDGSTSSVTISIGGGGTISGTMFHYSEPTLRQANGSVRVQDFAIGSYGLSHWGDNFEVKSYIGYSHQRYHFDRYYLNQQYSGKASSDTLSVSYEVTRPFCVQPGFWLKPLTAIDFEQTWMWGYRETGGSDALAYSASSLERLMLRVGLGCDFALRKGLVLNGRIQYAMQLNTREYAKHNVRHIENGSAASVLGSRIGRDYLNIGIGGNWRFNNRGDGLFVNYDTKLYNRATLHIGEAGFVRRW